MKKSNNWEKVMKNVFRLLLASFVLFGMSSCSQIMYGDRLGEGAESVAFSFRAPSGSIENGKLTLSISDGSKTETFETGFSGGSVSHEFKKVPVRKKISIYAKVESTIINMPAAPDETELLYEGATDIVTKRGKNVVNLGLDAFSGYFLWFYNSGNGYAASKIEKKEITSGTKLENNFEDRTVDVDFNEKGEIILFKDTGRYCCFNDITGTDSFFFPEAGLGAVTSFASYKKGAFYSDIMSPDGAINISYSQNGESETAKTVIKDISNLPSYPILAMEVYGNNIFIASIGGYYLVDDGYGNITDKIPTKIFFNKGVISETGGNYSINFEPPVSYENYGTSKIVISDMQYKDGYLYALSVDLEGKHSKGQLLKIDPNSMKVIDTLGSIPADNDWGSENNINRQFVGPRQFIAIKPKKLVIADAGYVSTGDTIKKRVVYINLDTFDFEKIVDLEDTNIFDGSFDSGSGYSADYPLGNGLF